MKRFAMVVTIAILATAASISKAGVVVAKAANSKPSGRIVFSRLEAGRYHLYSVRPDGSGLTQLTNGPADDTQPDVSRDGRIVFSRGWGTFPRGPYTQLYIRERNGATHPVLASPSTKADYIPRWSPDGKRIVFTRADPGGEAVPIQTHGAVWIVNANGTGLRPISPPENYQFAAWAPDGRHIAHLGPAPDMAPVLYVTNVDRPFKPRRITKLDAFQPRYSADGSRLVFTSMRDSASWQVYVMRSDGRGQRRLTFTGSHQDKFPSFSPDGKWIAFESTRDNDCPPDLGAQCRPARLYVMRADGSGQHPITAGPADSYPVWVD
jgi:TolB protein